MTQFQANSKEKESSHVGESEREREGDGDGAAAIARRDSAVNDARRGSRESESHSTSLYSPLPSAFSPITRHTFHLYSYFTQPHPFLFFTALLIFFSLVYLFSLLSSIQCNFKCFKPTFQSCELPKRLLILRRYPCPFI